LKKSLLLFIAIALFIAGPGLLSGRRLVPADLPGDLLAWKGDPAVRVRVSNSLLSDVPLQLVPWDMESRRLIASGQMPWMNRFAGTTEHLFANPLAGLLSPFTWPRLLFGLRGWAWTVLLKMVAAALSAYWLARALGCDTRVATVAGALYALSGYSIVWALYPHTNVFVVLPALAAAGVQRRIIPTALLAALATAGGHPETLFVGVVGIFIFLFATKRPIVPFALASLAGFLLIGIQLVPFGIALKDSYAIRARSEQLEVPFRLLTPFAQILPGYLGSPLRDEIDLTGTIASAENFNQRSGGFIGATVLLAIALGFAKLRRDLRISLSIATAALMLALAIPGVSQIMKFIPLVKWVAFEYFQVAFVLFATVCGAMALQAVAYGRVRPRLARVVMVIAALLFIAGITPLIAPRAIEAASRTAIGRLQERGYLKQPAAVYEQRIAGYLAAARVTALRRAAIPALCWLLAGTALLTRASRRRETVLAGAAIAELAAFAFGYNPAIRVDEIAREPRAIAAIRQRDPAGEWLTASSLEVFPPNLGTTFGVRQSHAYDILTSDAETTSLLPTGYDPKRWALPSEPSTQQLAALASRGVRFYVTSSGVVELPGARKPPPPRNHPPRGLGAGAIVSAAGALLLWFAVRRYSHSIVLGGLEETS
jgi:hypothetical protein